MVQDWMALPIESSTNKKPKDQMPSEKHARAINNDQMERG